jgi:ABC-2 type transport system permease protein
MKILELMRKDRKVLILLFLIPIVAVLGAGFIFSKIYIENIPFGIADLDNSSLSRTIVRQFKIHPGLKVDYYADSESDLKVAVKSRRVWGGLVIPRRFYQDVLQGKSPKTVVLINGTNVVVGNNALGYSSAILGTLSAGFQLNVLEGRGLVPYLAKQSLTAFSFGERILYEPTLSYLGYLLCMIVAYIIQTFYLCQFIVPLLMEAKSQLAGVSITSRENREWLKELAARMAGTILILGVSSYIALKLGEQCYGIPVRGNFFEHFALIGVFLLAISAMAFVFAAIFDNLNYFLQTYTAFAMVTLLTAGLVWPEYIMPKALVMIIKCIWPMFHVLYPLKALHLKTLGWDMVLPSIGHTLLYALFWIPIGISFYYYRIRKDEKIVGGTLSEPQ